MAIIVNNGVHTVTTEDMVWANYPYYFEVVGHHYDDIVADITQQNKSDWGFYVQYDIAHKVTAYLHFKTKAQMLYYRMKV